MPGCSFRLRMRVRLCAGKLATNSGVVGKFSFLTVRRNYPVAGKARSRPQILNQFSYWQPKWASTELVKSYQSPKKSGFYQRTPKILLIFIPQ